MKNRGLVFLTIGVLYCVPLISSAAAPGNVQQTNHSDNRCLHLGNSPVKQRECAPTPPPPPPTPTVIFKDDFNRPDGDVGNGWSTGVAGSGCSQGISSNSYYNSSTWDGNCWLYRTDIHPVGNFAIYTEFSSSGLINGRDGENLNLTYRNNAGGPGEGFGLVITPGTSPNLRIVDRNGNQDNLLAGADFPFNNSDTFAAEVDVDQAHNWIDVYVWDKNTNSKPSIPSVSFNNGGSTYAPVATGSNWLLSFSNNGSYTSYTVSDYVYEVSQL